MALSDLPVVGRVAALGGLVGDLLLNGGDLVVSLGFVLVTHIPEATSLLLTLNRLAGRLEWVPTAFVEDLLTVALVVLLVYRLARFATDTDNDN